MKPRLSISVALLYLALVLSVMLPACTKESDKTPVNHPGITLHRIKAAASGKVQNEFILNNDGTVKARISYKDFSQNLIAAKDELIYKDGRLHRVQAQLDYSSAQNAVQYVYSAIEFDYNQAGQVIQRNYFTKEGDDYKLRSFTVYEYNSRGWPVKETRFDEDGVSFGYNSYDYDATGNVITMEEYKVDRDNGTTRLERKTAFRHDTYKNPYTHLYHPIELIPFSVNSNNITEEVVTYYDSGGLGVDQTIQITFGSYNQEQYPLEVNENGHLFRFEYQ